MKPKERKLTSTLSGRERRRMADATAANHPVEEPVISRKVYKTRMHVFALKKKHSCVTLVVGYLKQNIERAENNEEFGQFMLHTIQNCWTSLISQKDSHNWQLLCWCSLSCKNIQITIHPQTQRIQVFTAVIYVKDKAYQQNLLRLIISSRNQNEDVERILLSLTPVQSKPTTHPLNQLY